MGRCRILSNRWSGVQPMQTEDDIGTPTQLAEGPPEEAKLGEEDGLALQQHDGQASDKVEQTPTPPDGPEPQPETEAEVEEKDHDLEQMRDVKFLEGCANEWGLLGDAAQSAVVCQLAITLSREPNPYRIQEHTGYELELVRATFERMIWNGILCYSDGGWGMCVEWPEDETGMSVLTDCMVAAGVMYRDREMAYCVARDEAGRRVSHPAALSVFRDANSSEFGLVRFLQEKETTLTTEEACRIVFFGLVKKEMPGSEGQRAYWSRKSRKTPTFPDELIDYLLRLHRTWMAYCAITS